MTNTQIGQDKAADQAIPVIIAGAGPVGLITSVLLARQGIRSLVLEKRSGISELPRARGINTRSAEILGQVGLSDELEQIAMSELWSSAFVYTETLGGRVIGHMPGAMAPGAAAALSPARYITAAQDRIDPMIHAAAARQVETEIRFDTEVIGFDQDKDGVTVEVREKDGSIRRIGTRYLIAADGGKSPLREMAGIGESGRANLRSFINNHVRADLSRFTKGREGALIWTLQPGLEGVFQMLDEKDMWAIQVQYDPATFDLARWTDDYATAHIRAMIGVPEAENVEIEIFKAYGYTLSMMLSDRLVEGRLLLAGDAAHQIPPYGGFGLNTGIQTAHNLAWKVAAVLKGEAHPDLLQTYDTERRQVALRVCDFGRTNAGYVEQLMSAVRNSDSFEQKQSILQSSRQYGNWWGLDLGLHYEGDGAFVPDDVAPPAVENAVVDYLPHAKPGYRAPHFWARLGNERVSSIDLCHTDFVLFAGADGGAWIDALQATDPGVRTKGYRVASDGDLVPEIDFLSLYGIEDSGAVLVRPDGMVAFRAARLTNDPASALRAVLDRVLCRARLTTGEETLHATAV